MNGWSGMTIEEELEFEKKHGYIWCACSQCKHLNFDKFKDSKKNENGVIFREYLCPFNPMSVPIFEGCKPPEFYLNYCGCGNFQKKSGFEQLRLFDFK